MNDNPKPIPVEEWRAEARRRFGQDAMKWRFVCPSCGHVQTPEDFKKAGAPSSAVGYSCIGRWDGHMHVTMGTKPGPCNYTGGGLFNINPIPVVVDGKTVWAFAFADAPSPAGVPR